MKEKTIARFGERKGSPVFPTHKFRGGEWAAAVFHIDIFLHGGVGVFFMMEVCESQACFFSWRTKCWHTGGVGYRTSLRIFGLCILGPIGRDLFLVFCVLLVFLKNGIHSWVL